MNFDIEIAHSVEEVGQETWDQLGKERPFADYRWYRFCEAIMVEDKPIYIILFSSGVPVARATFWLKWKEQFWMSPVINLLLDQILRRWPMLACRTPLANRSGLILPGDPQLRDAALRAIAQVAQDQMQEYKVSFLSFDYMEHHETKWPSWPDTFSATLLTEPETIMNIAWPDFDTYLSSRSYKTRKNYRRYIRAADRAGIEITLHPTVTDIDEAMVLMRNVEKRYREPPVPWRKRLLENAGMVDAVWLTARVGERLVGCELMLGSGDSWMVTAIGRDYDFENVYFLLGYVDIRCAIEKGAKVLRWGTCTYDVKRRFGFQTDSNNYVVFTSRLTLLNRFGRWVAQMEERRALAEAEAIS